MPRIPVPVLWIGLLGLVVLGGCTPPGEQAPTPAPPDPIVYPAPVAYDLDAILARDTLVVLTQFNSTSYFLYRGEPMGYEFDFLRHFAQARDLHIRTRVVRNRDSLFVMLNQGVGDVVAARLTPTAADSEIVAFAPPLYRTNPVLVQRDAPIDSAAIPEAAAGLAERIAEAQQPDTVTFNARLIRRPRELTGEEVHVLDETRFEQRLLEISDRATGEIFVVEVDSGTTEMLMQDVAQGVIGYTIGHENLANLVASHYTNLALFPVVDQPYAVAWAVRSNAPSLRAALSSWIEGNPGLARNLYRRYFIDRKGFQERIRDAYLTSETGKLSPYDSLFKHHAPRLGWDWRLLASQAFQESRFKPRAKSWAGAMGLLQLMPATAREFGTTRPYDPADNVAGAVRFLEWLYGFWDNIPDERERLKFILGSYNAGPGHVQDARALTKKHGGDPYVWKDVAYWLLRLSEHEVYNDPVVKYGFCRGLEPVVYVGRILDRYDHYMQFVEPLAVRPPPDATEG